MAVSDKEAIVRQIPLFSAFSPADQKIICDNSSLVEYKKDHFIYKEGDSANAFFCIVSGRILLYAKDGVGHDNVLEYLHRGKYFGIISLLTGEPHSVTAKAINDAVLLRIEKANFDSIIAKIPQLSMDLMQTLSRRLKRKDIHSKRIFESTIISIYSSYAQAGKTVYAMNLALSLKKETHKDIVLLDISHKGKLHNIAQKLGLKSNGNDLDLSNETVDLARLGDFLVRDVFGIDMLCVSYDPEAESNVRRIVAVLSLLVNDCHYIILDLPVSIDQTILGTLNQSDLIQMVSSPDPSDLTMTRRLIDRLREEYNFSSEKIKVILNENKQTHLSHEEKIDLLGQEIFATLPSFDYNRPERMVLDEPDIDYARAVRRIARQVGDCRIGLALGAGAAFGLAHIGVLKVIEEEHIPIDIISGSSIGAVVAAFWAAGIKASEIEKITLNEFKNPNIVRKLMDITFPTMGFLKGYRISGLIKKYLGKKTFYDVKMPLKILACDIRHKRSIIVDKGYIADAVAASCAMPGIFRPVKLKEELLLDGSVLNPLPTEVLVRESVTKIIAVNVTPSREEILKDYEQAKEKKALDAKEISKVNILDFIFGSIELMQSELAVKESQFADVVLHPDTRGLNWLEFYKAKEFIQRGEEDARRNLAKIKQLVSE